MEEILKYLSDVEYLLTISLFFIPGSIFYSIIFKQAFPSGRFNLTFTQKFIFIVFTSLMLSVLFPLFFNSNFFKEYIAYPLVKSCGGVVLIDFLHFKISSWDKFIYNLSTSNFLITEKVYLFLFLFIYASLLGLVFSIFVRVAEGEIRNNFVNAYIFQYIKYVSVNTIGKSVKANQNLLLKTKTINSEVFLKILGQKILSIFYILILFCIFIFSLLMHVLSWTFYQFVIYFNHPLYVEIFRSFKGRKVAVCEILTNQNILFKGELVSIQPKNVSELEYLSIKNVIKYSIENQNNQFHQESRNVFRFKNNESILSIPYREIDNFNIWLLKDLTVFNYKLDNEHNVETFLWYVRLHLKYRRYENPEEVIRSANDHGDRKIQDPKTREEYFVRLMGLINMNYPKNKIDIHRTMRKKLILIIYRNLRTEIKNQLPFFDLHEYVKEKFWD